jgi:hypothetical protein
MFCGLRQEVDELPQGLVQRPALLLIVPNPQGLFPDSVNYRLLYSLFVPPQFIYQSEIEYKVRSNICSNKKKGRRNA